MQLGFLDCIEVRGHFDHDPHVQVAKAVALHIPHPAALETEQRPILSAGRNLDDSIAFQRGDLDLTSEYGCDKMNRDVTEDIVPLALEDRVRLDGN